MRGLQPIDRKFLLLLIAVCGFGLLMLLSASGPLGYQTFSDSYYFFKHQLFFGFLPGVVIFYILSRLDYRKLKSFAALGLFLSVLLLVMVYMPGIGLKLGGSERWVKIFGLAFQPSEFVKVTFLLYMSVWLAARKQEAKTVQEGLMPFLFATGIVGLLLILQPNTGSMSVIVISAVMMYMIAGAPWGWFALMGAGGVGLLALLIKLTPYRAARFMTFLHPELDPKGIGYHINQAFLAIGSGGLFGLGYGHSRQKFLYLPEVAGDSVFAVMAEEMGFFITSAFIVLLGFFVYRIIKIAEGAPDEFGRYLATGIGSWIAVQTVLNVSSMMGLLPMTGVTLPFVSYGSSAFLALAMGMGLVASISRQSRL
jgi:cell division protein FtsW